MSKVTNCTLRSVVLAGVAVLAVAAQPAYAATVTGTLDSTATVTSNCAVTTTAVAFGNIDVTKNVNVDNTGGVSVTCTNGTGWTLSADAGGGGGTITDRRMKNGTELLKYALYKDDARSIIFGDGTLNNGSTITGTGTGSAQANIIYGRVPSGQTAAKALAYSDAVTVTITY